MSKSYMNLDVTYQFAVKKFALRKSAEICSNSGSEYDAETNNIIAEYLGEKYFVSYPDGVVDFADKEGEVSLPVKILILHYLATANGTPLQNKWISFKELPDGAIYNEPFTRRAIKPMLSMFADRQNKFVELAKTLGGRVQNIGDTSVTIDIFPRVSVTYVIWSGDEEFAASGNVLFDASAPNYLPTEDYAVISGMIIYHLGALLQKSGQ